jgi:hypothetical protein
MLDAAETLADLAVPPGNRLEKLAGDRAGEHSIWVNRQWRICFRWTDAGPEDVEIADYPRREGAWQLTGSWRQCILARFCSRSSSSRSR